MVNAVDANRQLEGALHYNPTPIGVRTAGTSPKIVFGLAALRFELLGYQSLPNFVHHFFERTWSVAVHKPDLLRNLNVDSGSGFGAYDTTEMFQALATLMPACIEVASVSGLLLESMPTEKWWSSVFEPRFCVSGTSSSLVTRLSRTVPDVTDRRRWPRRGVMSPGLENGHNLSYCPREGDVGVRLCPRSMR
jgi:hypothetical protein